MTQPEESSVEWMAVTTLSLAQLPMVAVTVLCLMGALAEGGAAGMLVFVILAFLTVCLTVVNIQIASMRQERAREQAS